ncbi:MAG: DegT/DnrJ/EryC1/StrS family aminotransferase [Saprospiraceae bacterium]|nr:DegT/DnrJ/EryC1/StrS family aminotransferase [Saprospiraceae bacterium]
MPTTITHIPFCRPLIDQPVMDEVMDCLTQTGWLTSGPKVLALEAEIQQFTSAKSVICVNSWTSGAMLILRWFGVGPGDEVIIPAYTYAATALCAINLGAKVVMVDVKDDFTLDPTQLAKAITPRTKVIIPVDIGGWPADYQAIETVIKHPEIIHKFQAESPEQEKLGRILILADAAHSLGAVYRGKPVGTVADVSVFSFHSVKNITTGEGGAVALNLPEPFDHTSTHRFLKTLALNGQTKSAFEKNQAGGWRYDIVEAGLKANMPDLCAAVGLAQIRRYETSLLPERKQLFLLYQHFFSTFENVKLPNFDDFQGSISSCHLYQLRFTDYTDQQRDWMIDQLAKTGIGTNVHYIPLPMLTLFKNLGFRMEDYPQSYRCFQGEISLPIYNGLSPEEVKVVCSAIQRIHISR